MNNTRPSAVQQKLYQLIQHFVIVLSIHQCTSINGRRVHYFSINCSIFVQHFGFSLGKSNKIYLKYQAKNRTYKNRRCRLLQCSNNIHGWEVATPGLRKAREVLINKFFWSIAFNISDCYLMMVSFAINQQEEEKKYFKDLPEF